MANPTKRQFYEFALERMKQEHADLLDVWKQMDSKAQATASIAGVFLASAFAFVKNALISLGWVEKSLLSVAVVSLVATIWFALTSMRIRATYSPLTGGRTLQMVQDVLEHPASESGQRYVNMLDQTLTAWKKVNSQLRAGADDKSAFLRRSQTSLLLSAAAVLVLTVATIIETPSKAEGSKNGIQTDVRR